MLAIRNPPARCRPPAAADRAIALAHTLREEFGTPFRLFDGSTGALVFEGDAAGGAAAAARPPTGVIVAVAADGRPQARLLGTERYRLALPIREAQGPTLVAVGDLPALARNPRDSPQEKARLQRWLRAIQRQLAPPSPPALRASRPPGGSDQLAHCLEAIVELDELLRGREVSEAAGDDRSAILRRIAAVLPVETLVWAPARGDGAVVIQGAPILSAQAAGRLADLLSRRPAPEGSGGVILNQFAASPLGRAFPAIVNLLAVRVGDADAAGWLVALNRREAGPDDPAGSTIAPFRRLDVALVMPFASSLGLQARFGRRNAQFKQLFAGLIGSLTAAIDARDSYTFGHSERVARVAAELGRELGLDEVQLGDVYLGGLLHDIGKIGVRDAVLHKPGPLTPEEVEQVRQHVRIGHRILADFRAIDHLLPLVLHHHERLDGSGYPGGLSGDAIPLGVRILAVADSYDAMNSCRSYRAAMPREQVGAILARGRGILWDEAVVDAFFQARTRIAAIEKRGVGESVCFALDNAFRRSGS